ncbi:hypothetical protein ACFL43_04585 [Thermodesulfobacteriota bacterium]
MNKTWITFRKDVFLRDLFQEFFDAWLYFEKIRKKHKKSSAIPFKMLDDWVGSENKKGPLWHLKDQSHRLFRNSQYKSSLYEHLFDWTMGSIFHEAMKLKEDSYQVESYKPLLELEVSRNDHNQELSKIINEYFVLIENANKNLINELQNVDELLSKAIYHLREIFILKKKNIHLLRLLLDNQKTARLVFGKKNLDKTFTQMYPEGMHTAYITVAKDCREHGWMDAAYAYAQSALKSAPGNKSVVKLLNELKKAAEH